MKILKIILLFMCFTSCDDIVYTSYIKIRKNNKTVYYQVDNIVRYRNECLYTLNVRGVDSQGFYDKIEIIDSCGKFSVHDKIVLTPSKKQ